MSLAFTVVCLYPEDGQLSHNTHFIEIIVLIIAFKIYLFVIIVEPHKGMLHTGIQKWVKSAALYLRTGLRLKFFSLTALNYDFGICSFLSVVHYCMIGSRASKSGISLS